MVNVSVLLPVRNGEAILEQAIESLSRQTLTDIKIVVVNDGSTDGTSSILSGYSDRRLKIILLLQTE